MEQWTGSKLGKKNVKASILLPCLFNLHVEYIMQNARLDEAQAGIKIAGRNISNLRYADDITLMAFCMMYSTCKLNKQGDNIQP